MGLARFPPSSPKNPPYACKTPPKHLKSPTLHTRASILPSSRMMAATSAAPSDATAFIMRALSDATSQGPYLGRRGL